LFLDSTPTCRKVLPGRFLDLHPFHADPDLDPFHADPDLDPGLGIFADADPGFEIFADPDPGLDFFQILVFFLREVKCKKIVSGSK